MLLDALPVPSPVRIAGRLLPVRPLALRDLAALDAYARDRLPLDVAAPAEGLSEWRQRRHWARMYRRAKDWPPSWGSEAARALSGSIEGKAFFAMLVVAGLAAAEAVEVAQAPDHEWRALSDAAYGRHPIEWLAVLLDPSRPIREPGMPTVTLEEAIDELASERGWTYEQIGALTITQFRLARNGGKARSTRLVLKPGETARQAATERRRLFAHLDRDDDDEPTEARPDE